MKTVAPKRQRADRALRRAMWLLGLMVFVLIIVAIATLPLFRIQRIEIQKTYFVPEQRILELSGLHLNQHMFSGYGGSVNAWLTGRYLAAEERIHKAYPQLQHLRVSLHFPGELRISFSERVPVAFLQAPDSCVLIDRDGKVLALVDKAPGTLPVIKGLEVISAKVGEKIQVDVPEQLERTISVLSALVEADREDTGMTPLIPQILEIRPSAYEQIYLKVKTHAGHILSVTCTQNQYLAGHFIWLRRVLQGGSLDKAGPGTLDLSGKNQVFRPLGSKWQSPGDIVASEAIGPTEPGATSGGTEATEAPQAPAAP